MPKPNKRRSRVKTTRDSLNLIPIVADGALAMQPQSFGKLIPLLILDTRTRPDVDQLIVAHRHLPPGDVTAQWATSLEATPEVFLELKFIRPVECHVRFAFDLRQYGGFVDAIVRAGLLYLQGGAPGDRLSTSAGAHRILVEVSSEGFQSVWEKYLHSSMRNHFRSRGMGRAAARGAAGELIAMMRELNSFRLPYS
jgi:hypothetical protein